MISQRDGTDGSGLGVRLGLGQAVAVKESPRDRGALAVATCFIFADEGLGFGPVLLGLLIPLAGYSGMYLSLTVAALIYFICYGRPRSPQGAS